MPDRVSTLSFPDSDPIVVVAAKRTAIGRFLGSLSAFRGVELGERVIRALVAETGAPIDRVFMGTARPAGTGPNPARQAARRAGLPVDVPAATVNMACASGLEAIVAGARTLLTGEASWVVAGGMESMSRVPFLLDRFRTGYRLGHATVEDAMYRDGFYCPLAEQVMGETAETLAVEYGIPRSEQDAFALESQQKAARALELGRFDGEITPIEAPAGAKGGVWPFVRDEHPRADTTLEQLAKLPPVFSSEGGVTAGNSSGLTDAAAAVVLTRASEAKRVGLAPMARLRIATTAGVDPKRMGIGPVPAVRELLARERLSLEAIDLVELNEAFAAQVLACDRDLHFDRARLNVNGGAIALGHPIGATGARMVTTLLHELARRGGRLGLATLCVSGGLGQAVLFER